MCRPEASRGHLALTQQPEVPRQLAGGGSERSATLSHARTNEALRMPGGLLDQLSSFGRRSQGHPPVRATSQG